MHGLTPLEYAALKGHLLYGSMFGTNEVESNRYREALNGLQSNPRLALEILKNDLPGKDPDEEVEVRILVSCMCKLRDRLAVNTWRAQVC